MSTRQFTSSAKSKNTPIVMDLTKPNATAAFFENLIRWVSKGHSVIYIEFDSDKESIETLLKPFSCNTRLIESFGEWCSRRIGYAIREYSIGNGQCFYLKPLAISQVQDLTQLVSGLSSDGALEEGVVILDSLVNLMKNQENESGKSNLMPDFSALSPLIESTQTTWIVLDR